MQIICLFIVYRNLRERTNIIPPESPSTSEEFALAAGKFAILIFMLTFDILLDVMNLVIIIKEILRIPK